MDDQRDNDDLIRRCAEMRGRSARVRADAVQIVACSAELIGSAAETHEAVLRTLRLLPATRDRAARSRPWRH